MKLTPEMFDVWQASKQVRFSASIFFCVINQADGLFPTPFQNMRVHTTIMAFIKEKSYLSIVKRIINFFKYTIIIQYFHREIGFVRLKLIPYKSSLSTYELSQWFSTGFHLRIWNLD